MRRRLLIALALIVATAASASAAVAHDQTIKVADHAGNATAVSGAFTPASAGALVIAKICLLDPGAGNPVITAGGVTLDGSTAFQQDQTSAWATGDGNMYIYSLANVSAASHTVTINKTNVARVTAFITVVTGAATSSYTDGTGAAATGNSTTPSPGTMTVTNADDFWDGFFCSDTNDDASASPTPNTNWTKPTNGEHLLGATDAYAATEYRANPGTTSGATASWSGATSGNWGALSFAYKAAGGGGGGPTCRADLLLHGAGGC